MKDPSNFPRRGASGLLARAESRPQKHARGDDLPSSQLRLKVD